LDVEGWLRKAIEDADFEKKNYLLFWCLLWRFDLKADF